MTGNPYEPSIVDPSSRDDAPQTQGSKHTRLRRIARLLGWSPFLLAVPTFLIVAEAIPERNHGSIADGFRKLNVFLVVMLPLAGCCWGAALLITAGMDMPSIPRSRRFGWLAVFAVLILVTIVVFAIGS